MLSCLHDKGGVMFKVGDTFHILLNGQNPAKPPHKCHVVGIVDVDYVVYKWYGRHKQWWHYDVMSASELIWRIDLCKLRGNND